MKIHLPLSLRRALMGVLAMVAVSTTQAAIMHSSVSSMVYMDFGQNMGRYVAEGYENSLLAYIRQQAGGTYIYYGDEKYADFRMPHGMIDFSSQNDGGYGAAVGINFYATVWHNATHTNTYTGNYIGSGNAIVYQSIEYRASNTFLLTPSQDFKISRQSKILTDIAAPVMYGANDADPKATWQAMREGALAGEYLYRTGSGRMEATNPNGSKTYVYGPYQYSAGGMATITRTGGFADDGAFVTYLFMRDYTDSGVNETYPLPVAILAGDSGSPSWVWNEQTQAYEYLASGQAGDFVSMSHYRGAPQWATETMDSFSVRPDLTGVSEVHIGAVNVQGDTYTDDYDRTTTTWKGSVTDGTNKLAEFIGMKTGVNTWKDLSGLKDTDNWYHYGNGYLTTQKYEDYFFTENLVFKATAETTSIVADADVDLGVGYIQLSKGEGMDRARFDIGGSHLINSAGYVIDKGVDAYITLTNSADYMREWRAVVDAGSTLHIEGSGNTNALLNLGGQGTTYLNRTGGYAAYNVLANNGARVVISDTNQIWRDFTFGFRGGVLDMNGNNLTWNNDGANHGVVNSFTIHALDEYATITNSKDSSFLLWTQGGKQTWLGSFTDEGTGTLIFAYNGGANGVLTMRSTHTSLTNAGSGIQVYSGTLRLEGTNTIHGKGSIDGRSTNRFFSNDDWHYVDTTANVTVAGGTFELGSHARLTGDVTVSAGASFVMREGVKHRYEYVEGGILREDTYQYADFYGLKGDIVNNGTVRIEYSEGATATNTYAKNISGTGSMSIALGTDGAKLVLSGANTMTGAREVESGTLILDNAAALGSATGANAWKIGEKAVLVSRGSDQSALMSYVHGDSNGALALTADVTTQFDMSGHQNLILGAEEGKTVQYGTEGTSTTLNTWHTEDGRNQWLLGGGGGEIVVNWKLTGDNDLVLGNPYMSGTVTLTNMDNDFTGKVVFTRGSNVVLSLKEQAALGHGVIDLSYGNSMAGSTNIAQMFESSINPTSDGVLLLDRVLDHDIDLPGFQGLTLGVYGQNQRFTGDFRIGENGTFRFGGPGGLVITNSLQANGRNDMLVDAQGFTTGSVVLDAAAHITGDVTVMGHDAAKEDASGITYGEMALVLNTDDALATAASVTAKDGGSLLVAAGTSQQMNTLAVQKDGTVLVGEQGSMHVANLQMSSGSLLTSADPARATVEVESGSVTGTVCVGNFTKVGEGVLTTNGNVDLSAGVLDVREGSVKLGSATTVNGTVRLHNDTTVNFNGKTLSGNLDVAAGETTTITGNMALSGAYRHLVSGGTLDISRLSSVSLTAPGGQTMAFGGTVKLGNTTLAKQGNTQNAGFSFANVEITGNATLSETQGNSIWAINSLNGSGRLTWSVKNTETLSAYSGSSSILKFTGAGDFDGTVVIDRGGSPASVSYAYRTMVEIAHNQALHNADVILKGVQNYFNNGLTDRSALAINTDNAHIKGLSNSDGFAVLYAGAAATSSKAGNPASTRKATLTLTGDDNYTFAGAVNGDAENGLSIVKQGAGTQTFSGATNVHDLTVQSGTLSLTNNNTNVYGSATISQGATLNITKGYTLATGNTLGVAAVDGRTDSAHLNANLTLAGGQLSFSGLAMRDLESGYLLDLGGSISAASGQTGLTIKFTDDRYLREGVSYKLASGDFSSLGWASSAYTGDSLQYYTAAFTADSSGLSVTFTHMSDVRIWSGTEAVHSWSDSKFADQSLTSSEGVTKRFIFDDNAYKEVVFVSTSNEMYVKEIDITGKDYEFSGAKPVLTNGKILLGVEASATFAQDVQSLYAGVVLERGSTAEFKRNLALGGNSVTLRDHSRMIQSGGTGTFTMNNASTGTLEVRSGATVNINSASGNAKYRLEGDGTVNLNATNAYSLDSRGNDFNGKLSINLGGNVTMQDGVFADTARPDIDLRGGNANTAFLLGASLADKSMEIGALSGASGTARILARAEGSSLSVNQTGNTTFAGTFAHADGFSDAGLVMNGSGTLTLTGANESTAALVVNSGTVAIAGENGKWNGEVTVNNGGNLLLQKDKAVAAEAALNVADGGVIQLANGVSMSHDIAATANEITVMAAADTASTLTGTLSLAETSTADQLRITKVGGGNLTLAGGAVGVTQLNVAAGTLTLAGESEWMGGVTVAAGATFAMNGTMNLISPIQNAGAVNFMESAVFSLTMEDFVDGRYDVISGSGTISGLTLDKFRIAGDTTGVQLKGLGTNAVYLSFAADEPRSLVWNGTETGYLWSDSNWLDGEETTTFFTGDSVSFTNAAANKHVVVRDGGSQAENITVSATGYTFTGGTVTATGNLTLASGTTTTFEGGLRVANEITLASGSRLAVGGESSLRLANSGTGTLEVLENGSVDIGAVSGTAKYHLAGQGTITMEVSGALYTLNTTGNEFGGTLDITLHNDMLLGGGSAKAFADGYMPDLILRNETATNRLVYLNTCYAGEDNPFNIGSLGSDSAKVMFTGANGANTATTGAYRYVAVHQDTDTVFAGTFENTAAQKPENASHRSRAVGLMMNGTHTLTLTGANESAADLIINTGTIAIGGENGKWTGATTVKDGGQLYLQKDNALGGALTISGNGVAAAEGVDAREGALKLADGVTVGNAISIGGSGASVMTGDDVTATISGDLTGGAFTKVGAGELALTGTLSLASMAVQAGTLALGGTVNLSSSIVSDGTVNFNGVTFQLSSDSFVDDRFDLVTGTGTTTGTLTADNFNVTGLSKNLRVNGLGTDTVYLSIAESDLIWAGTAGGNTWDGSNWDFNGTSTSFSTGDNVCFTNSAANKNVVLSATGAQAGTVSVTGVGYTFSGGRLTTTGAITVATGATASFANMIVAGTDLTVNGTSAFTSSVAVGRNLVIGANGIYAGFAGAVYAGGNVTVGANSNAEFYDSFMAEGNVTLAADSRMMLSQSGNITLNTSSTGTLEVAKGATINLGTSLPANFKLAGDGVVKMNPTSWFKWTSTGSNFNGTLEITLGNHFQLEGTATAGNGVFADSARPNIVLKGGSTDAGLILSAAYAGTDNALKIGSLAGESTAQIRGDMGVNGNRYIAVHQSGDTTFAGTFIEKSERSVGLIMNGTGTLTLTGSNASPADLIINKGTIAIGGANGKWTGATTVNSGGQLYLQKNNALGGTLTLNGTGVAASEGVAAREGALKLANGVTVGNAITIGSSGASVMTENGVTATLGGTLTGGTLTKIGAGTLQATSTTLVGAPVVVSAGKVAATDTLGGTAALGNVTVSDNGTLGVKLAADAAGTQLTLNTASTGTVEVASGMLRVNAANASQLGSAALKMAGGSGLTFAESANSTRSEFSNDINIASGTLTLQAWGNSSLSADNILSGKITGAGTLRKTDGGKVTLAGDMSGFSGTLAVAADGYSSGNNKLFVDTDATVSALSFESQGALLVGTDHKLTVAGATKDNLASYFAHIVSDATHAGTVLLAIDKVDSQKLSGTHNVSANFEFTAATGLELNNWNASSAYNSLVNVNEGGSITVKNGTLAITSFQEMSIEGGTVTAPTVQIGYNQDGNFRGHLTLESGTLATKNIVMYCQSSDWDHLSKFTMTGGTLDLRGGTGKALSITGGAAEVTISGGKILVDAMRSVDGYISLGGVEVHSTGEGSGITFASDGGVTWTGAITNNGGSLNLDGQFALKYDVTVEQLEATKAGYVDTLDAESGNGYADNRFWLVRNTNGGTTSLSSAIAGYTVTKNGTTYAIGSDGNGVYLLAQGGAAGEGLYYVNSAEGTVYGDNENSAATAQTTGIVVRGGKLTLAQSLASTVTQGISLERDTTVYINTGATLSNAEVHRDGGALTIDGTGVYVNGTGKALTATMADTWAGTIQVNGDLGSIQVDSFGKTANNSTVRFAGVNGWFEPSKPDSTLNIDLLNPDASTPAINLVDTSGKTYNFAGKVSGTGDMAVKTGSSGDVASNTDAFNFNGDVSEWTGKLSVTTSSGHNMKATFAGNALNMDIERKGDAGKLSVELTGDKTMTGSITGAVVTVQNKLTLAEDASISTGAGLTMTTIGEQGSISSAKIEGLTISSLGTGGQISNLQILYENAKLTVSDMVISADSFIGKPQVQSAMLLSGTVAPISIGSSDPVPTELSLQRSKLILQAELNATLTSVTLAQEVSLDGTLVSQLTSVKCTNFLADILSGSLLLDFSEIWDEILGLHNRYVMVEFVGVDELAADADIKAIVGNSEPVPAITYGTAGGHAVVYFDTAAIPEPATATLSLLALAALAARRRRIKK